MIPCIYLDRERDFSANGSTLYVLFYSLFFTYIHDLGKIGGDILY